MTSSREVLRAPGRPQQSIQVRADLIHHARLLFIAHPYEKVSLRMVANNAGVNMGMIRYYFNDKAGLFETMLRETLSPMQQALAEVKSGAGVNLLLILMTNFYQVMSLHKNFPRFISRTLQLSKVALPRKIVESTMRELLPIMKEKVYAELNTEGVLQEGISPQLGYFTWLNLMTFPFVAPPEILELHGFNINDDFLSSLLVHNTHLLKQGIIN